MHRRDFLHPRHLAQTAGHILGAAGSFHVLSDQASEPALDPGTALLRLSRRCMATTFEFVVPYGTENATEVAREAFDHLDQLESQLTVYRDSSEVSHLNRLASFQPVPVEEGLFDLLTLAAEISEVTGGAFDVTAGALVKAWGFYRGPRRVPAESERLAALGRVGMRHVVLDAEKRSVQFLRSGLEINLGSIGKGYALDRLASWLQQELNLPAVLLQGGSSSVYAKGSPTADNRGWPVDLRHPWQPGHCLARLWLRDKALGTSAATFQYLEHEGRKLGHVLDPRTGWPAEGVASATVVAPTAAEADAFSTAFFVGGLELARAVCSRRSDIGCVLLPEGEDAEVVVLNLAPDCASLPAGAPGTFPGDLAGRGLN
jgi:thiamine biosynthesis lipoprotein